MLNYTMRQSKCKILIEFPEIELVSVFCALCEIHSYQLLCDLLPAIDDYTTRTECLNIDVGVFLQKKSLL